jgi:RNA polymerase subunit RPABC4/transcription elongation factor Spt4
VIARRTGGTCEKCGQYDPFMYEDERLCPNCEDEYVVGQINALLRTEDGDVIE